MRSTLKLIGLLLMIASVVPGAWAAPTWRTNYGSNNLRDWYVAQCGGQGWTCPCAPPWDTWTYYAPGSCRTDPSTSAPGFPLQPSGGRFQVVAGSGSQSGKAVLQVTLAPGDVWPGRGTRNEMVYAQETPGTPTHWGAGDTADRWYEWSDFFASQYFATWHSSSPRYNVWGVDIQWRQAGDYFPPPIAFGLNASSVRDAGGVLLYPNGYKLTLVTKDKYDDNYLNERLQYTWDPLPLDAWLDFAVHIIHNIDNTGPNAGLIELWYGQNGGPKTQLVLACPNGTPVTGGGCQTITAHKWPAPGDYNYRSPESYVGDRTPGTLMPNLLKQGFYRNQTMTDTVQILHSDMLVGRSLNDVTPSRPDYSLVVSPPSLSSPQSSSSTAVVAVTRSDGFIGSVALGVSALPADAWGSFDPATVNFVSGGPDSLSSTLTLNAGTTSGAYPVSISGVSGALNRAASLSYTIQNIPVAQLTDSFAGTAVDSTKWSVTQTSGAVMVGGGTLNLAPNANVGGTQLIVQSIGRYNFANSSAYVKAANVVDGAGNVDESFGIVASPGNYLQMFYQSSQLWLFYANNGVRTQVATVPYNAAAHAWWRLSQSGTQVLWETSRDGVSWNLLASVNQSLITWDMTDIAVRFHVETYAGGQPTPGQANFASLNTAQAGSTQLSVLNDTFYGAGVDTTLWTVRQTLGTVTVSAGTLNLAPNAWASYAQTFLETIGIFNAIGSVAQVRVPQVVSVGGVNNRFYLHLDTSNYVMWQFENGYLYAAKVQGGIETMFSTIRYSPTAHLWWRLRETGGTFYWETSADGQVWRVLAQVATSSLFAIGNVRVRAYAEEWGSGAPGIAKYANLN